MVQRIELRIHAGAPSSRQDDDRYRALAHAYLGFAGHRQESVVNRSPQSYDAQRDITVVPATVLRPRPARQVDDSTTILDDPDDTTFIEDTQLAYDALESQIFTSSLTVPEVTLVPRTSSDDHDEEGNVSLWPEDLDVQSPHKPASSSQPRSSASGVEARGKVQIAFKVATETPQRLCSRHGDVQPEDETHLRHQYADQADVSAASMGFGKHRRLIGDDLEAAITKPLKLPLKRTASDTVALPVVEPLDLVAPRAHSQQSDRTTSSYLKTPILDRSKKRPRIAQGDDVPWPLPVERNINRRPIGDGKGEMTADAGLADYREQTPAAAYIAHAEGNATDLAFIGERQEHKTPGTRSGQERSNDSANSIDTTSELPTTYSLTSSTTSKRTPIRPLSQRSTSDPGPDKRPGESSVHTEGNRTSSLPAESIASPPLVKPTKKRSEQLGRDPAATGKDFAALLDQGQDVADAAHSSERPRQASADSAAPFVSPNETDAFETLAGLDQTIRPPHPQVSIEAFRTHITDSLAQLANDTRLKYNPISVARELRPSERGYWLIRTKNVPAQLQLDSWRFLKKYIGSGKAGWGVWCTRICQQDCTGPMGESDASIGDMKIFCWGEVVRHVYLLLYVASNSQVRRLGLQWIDADGQVVVQMRSKS